MARRLSPRANTLEHVEAHALGRPEARQIAVRAAHLDVHRPGLR